MGYKYNNELPPLPGDYTAPLNESDEDSTLDYGIYPSDNPDTPYIPNNPANTWWQELPGYMPGMTSSDNAAETTALANQRPSVGYGSNVWMTTLALAERDQVLTSSKMTDQIQEIYNFDGVTEAPKLMESLSYVKDGAYGMTSYQSINNMDAVFSNGGRRGPWLEEIERRRVGRKGSRYKRYSNYTGSDIVPSITLPNKDSYQIGEIATISVSVHSETFPVRMLGKRGAQGFTRGPRTIAGSIIFTQFDLYPFYDIVSSVYNKSREPWTTEDVYPLADSLPPFDITISFMNEYGNYGYESGSINAAMKPQGSVLRLYGVVIVDDGITLSIDDLVPETVYSYMAAGIAPMHYPSGWTAVE
jgi:hypothetical protein